MENTNLIKLDGSSNEQIEAISLLHTSLLPESKVSLLGIFFLKKFYYSILIKNNLIDSYIYKSGGKYAGFIVCTDRPFVFMKEGMRRNFLYLSFVLGVSVLTNPGRIKILWEMCNNNLSEKITSNLKENTGQFMSFGVLEDYRKVIDENTGLTISNLLMKKVFEHFRERKKDNFFLMVLKTNKRAIRFYEKYNGITLPDSAGESVIVKFDLKRAE